MILKNVFLFIGSKNSFLYTYSINCSVLLAINSLDDPVVYLLWLTDMINLYIF